MQGAKARGLPRDAGAEGPRRNRSGSRSQDTPQGGEEDLHEVQGVGPALRGGRWPLVLFRIAGIVPGVAVEDDLVVRVHLGLHERRGGCLLYTSDAADE